MGNRDLILSILTPAVPSRWNRIMRLSEFLAGQIGELPVEHLILVDNKRRTVGEKRDALLRAARGQYVAFVDDDDDVSGTYVAEILANAAYAPDVITFEQKATVDGLTAIIEFGLGNPNEPFPRETRPTSPMLRAKRNAWHVCAWRRQLAVLSHFPASNYGEDWAFAAPLCALPGLTSVHIPKVLHFYQHSAETTEAPPPLTSVAPIAG